MSENSLAAALIQSISAQSFSDSLKFLNSCHEIIANSSNTNSLIDFKVISLLNRLQAKYSSQIFLPLAKLYLSLTKTAENCSSTVLIKLCNEIIMLSEGLKSTDVSEELNDLVQKLLEIVAKTELDNDQREVVVKLLEKNTLIDYQDKFIEILQELSENKILGINKLFDLFSNFESFSTQVEVFSNKLTPVISVIQKLNNPEIIKRLLVFLEHFVFKFNFSVQFGEFTETYNLVSINKLVPSMIPTVLEILNTIAAYEISITQNLLPILQRL